MSGGDDLRRHLVVRCGSWGGRVLRADTHRRGIRSRPSLSRFLGVRFTRRVP